MQGFQQEQHLNEQRTLFISVWLCLYGNMQVISKHSWFLSLEHGNVCEITFLKEKLTKLVFSPQKWKIGGKLKMYKFNRDVRTAMSASFLVLRQAGRERMSWSCWRRDLGVDRRKNALLIALMWRRISQKELQGFGQYSFYQHSLSTFWGFLVLCLILSQS